MAFRMQACWQLNFVKPTSVSPGRQLLRPTGIAPTDELIHAPCPWAARALPSELQLQQAFLSHHVIWPRAQTLSVFRTNCKVIPKIVLHVWARLLCSFRGQSCDNSLVGVSCKRNVMILAFASIHAYHYEFSFFFSLVGQSLN